MKRPRLPRCFRRRRRFQPPRLQPIIDFRRCSGLRRSDRRIPPTACSAPPTEASGAAEASPPRPTTTHPLAGTTIMMQGGNAVDAIVAAAATLNVSEPYMSGIGGFGGFMMIYLAEENRVVGLDALGRAPAASSPDTMTLDDFEAGYKAPIVPGALKGWAAALERFGTMSLVRCLRARDPARRRRLRHLKVRPAAHRRCRGKAGPLPVDDAGLLSQWPPAADGRDHQAGRPGRQHAASRPRGCGRPLQG